MSVAEKKEKKSNRLNTAETVRVLNWINSNKEWIEGDANPRTEKILEAANAACNVRMSMPMIRAICNEAGVKRHDARVELGGNRFIAGTKAILAVSTQINLLGKMVENLYIQTRSNVPISLRDAFVQAAEEVQRLCFVKDQNGDGK